MGILDTGRLRAKCFAAAKVNKFMNVKALGFELSCGRLRIESTGLDWRRGKCELEIG